MHDNCIYKCLLEYYVMHPLYWKSKIIMHDNYICPYYKKNIMHDNLDKLGRNPKNQRRNLPGTRRKQAGTRRNLPGIKFGPIRFDKKCISMNFPCMMPYQAPTVYRQAYCIWSAISLPVFFPAKRWLLELAWQRGPKVFQMSNLPKNFLKNQRSQSCRNLWGWFASVSKTEQSIMIVDLRIFLGEMEIQ